VTTTLFSITEFKEHQGITSNDWNNVIGQLAVRVSAFCDIWCRRTLMAVAGDTIEYYDGSGSETLALARYPILSVTSVHVDSSRFFEDSSLIPSSSYVFDRAGHLRLLPGLSGSPATWAKGIHNVKVRYRGGYETVPPDLKEAAILWAASIFHRRRAVGITNETLGGYTAAYSQREMPPEAAAILKLYRQPMSTTRVPG